KEEELIRGSAEKFIVKISDEQSKINLNRIDTIGKNMLKELLIKILKINLPEAEEIVSVFVDWIDEDKLKQNGTLEDNFLKNKKLTIPEEAILILEYFYQKRTDDYKNEAKLKFSQLRDYITVYTDGELNINTASEEILEVLISALLKSVPIPDVKEEDVKGLVEKIIKGGNFQDLDMNSLETKLGYLSSEQRNILSNLISLGLIGVESKNFFIESVGKVGKIEKRIKASIRKDVSPKIVYWNEE
ncbi:MAG: general secretion pathway protein GspK, partial [Candidatus Omnitrophica bacterium]|nr:general secretion pathway protein GspK [Candidatus Omnitrophota bacterium]